MMKLNKFIITTYILVVSSILTYGIISCSDNKESKAYIFSSVIPDKSETISIDSINYLYDNGITYKNLDGNDYFLANNQDKYINHSLVSEVLLWGPITISRDSFYKYESEYKLVKTVKKNKVNVNLGIKFVSKFKGTITKLTFIPSWLAYVEGVGNSKIIDIPNVVINFSDGLTYGKEIPTKFVWTTTKEAISSDPIVISIKVIAEYSNGKQFEEYMLLNVDNP